MTSYYFDLNVKIPLQKWPQRKKEKHHLVLLFEVLYLPDHTKEKGFVLQKALELNHKVIVCVNKIDKKDSRVKEVIDEVVIHYKLGNKSVVQVFVYRSHEVEYGKHLNDG